ncbi:MAG: GTPase Era [Bacteroidales bacterium]|nr:GTPase Era [Bacteroidales bacterium]RLD36798.1 MAG: GTPase Era [Bacteroidota bacterium]
MSHKAGFVNILGNPNVGKSTLMNALVGEKLSIITSKAQTTRHRIMGIVNGEDFQIVYSDTPGIVDTAYKLHESMMNFVESALIDADIFLYLVEVKQRIKNDTIIRKINESGIPTLVLINKIDLSNQDAVVEAMEFWKEKMPNSEVIPMSALNNFNVDKVLDTILEKLPESPAYFSKDELTDKTERFFAQEIIREKILLNYQKEIPYSVEIEVESFIEEEKIIKIRANIYVARNTQKGIIIGHQGSMLKKVGTAARIDMEAFFDKKVFLELYVRVQKDWRNNERDLKRFGYL